MTTNPESKQAAQLMHHSQQTQEKVYNSSTIAYTLETTTGELKDAAKKMHHSPQMHNKIYNS